jgi:hypothetical protein
MRIEIITCDGCGQELKQSQIFARIGIGREQDVPRFIAMVPPSSALPYQAADEPQEVCSWECGAKILREFISHGESELKGDS